MGGWSRADCARFPEGCGDYGVESRHAESKVSQGEGIERVQPTRIRTTVFEINPITKFANNLVLSTF